MNATSEIGQPAPLGATLVDGGVNFSVYSRDATGVELLLFNGASDGRPSRVINMDAPGHRTVPASAEDLRDLRQDTVIGMIASQAVTFFIVICTAATLTTRFSAIGLSPDEVRRMGRAQRNPSPRAFVG